MTTAHRPTWKAAVGRASEGGYDRTVSTMRSVLDEAAHTKLKVRTGAQTVDREEALRISLQKLQEAEQKLNSVVPQRRQVIPEIEEEAKMKLLKHTEEQDVDLEIIQQKYDDRDEEVEDEDNKGWSDLDNTDDSDLENSENDDSDGEEDDSDEDDELALQAELAKIRAEREASKKREEERAAKEEQEKLEDAARLGNPLLSSAVSNGTEGRLKRRWNDDVVFRNQARGESDSAKKKRFINDTVRNDFHRRFLDKFIL